MPKLSPELAEKAACAGEHEDVILEYSERDVGFIGQAYCGACGAHLWTDPDPLDPTSRPQDRRRRVASIQMGT